MNKVLVILLVLCSSAFAAESQEVGKFYTTKGSGAIVETVQQDGDELVGLFVYDHAGLTRIYWKMTPEKARELHQMLGEAIRRSEHLAEAPK